MKKIRTIFIILTNVALLLALMPRLQPAQALWPPFRFNLSPAYQDGEITYYLRFASRVDWPITDVTITIPIPDGTRFLEADAEPATDVSFNGQEITFFTAVVHRPLKNAEFTVEVTDPTQTNFSTQAWISWQGEQPGEYLTNELSIDTTEKSPDWIRPPRASLDLEMAATVSGDTVTYAVYPTSASNRRMWDLKINLPLPQGTTFLEAEASPPFVASFDGREVSFFVVEMAQNGTAGPLRFKVSTEGVTAPFLETHAWATWKNAGRGVGEKIVPQEETTSSTIVVRPHTGWQQVVTDGTGDVPLANYDVTSLALMEDGPNLKIVFYTAGEVGPGKEPLQYIFYIDQDCQAGTGKDRRARSVEYQIKYKHNKDRTVIKPWDEEKGHWGDAAKLDSLANGKMVVIWVPYTLLKDGRNFCWLGQAKNDTNAFPWAPPTEWIPDNNLSILTQYQAIGSLEPVAPQSENSPSQSPPAQPGPTQTTPVYGGGDNVTPVQPVLSPATAISGKLAVPIDNGRVAYDLHLFSMPDGQGLAKIENARQPNIRFDGRRILINREGGGTENVYEYNFADGTQTQVSDAPRDSHPFYDPWGNRVVYGNAELTVGSPVLLRNERGQAVRDENREVVTLEARKPFIFVQCSLQPPHLETEPRCRDIATQGVLVPAGQMGEIQGTHPVWTTTDSIAYKGCNTWAGSKLCGIYTVPSASTKGFSNGLIPRRLTSSTTDIPSDTKGDLIAFTSHRDGNWEAYLMNLDGTGIQNLSNSPASNDGLPTISPDGKWVAFVSDRDGSWAIWVVPVGGSSPERLFNLPAPQPWGAGDRTWTNERISWGP